MLKVHVMTSHHTCLLLCASVCPPLWIIYIAGLTAFKFVLLLWNCKQVCTGYNILSYGFCDLIKKVSLIYFVDLVILCVCLNMRKLISIKNLHVLNLSLTLNRKRCRDICWLIWTPIAKKQIHCFTVSYYFYNYIVSFKVCFRLTELQHQ